MLEYWYTGVAKNIFELFSIIPPFHHSGFLKEGL
jgi:hypothetical protein